MANGDMPLNIDELPSGGIQQAEDTVAANRGAGQARRTLNVRLGIPYTAAEQAKLAGIEAGATAAAGLTAAQVRELIAAQAGGDLDDATRLIISLLVDTGTADLLTGAWTAGVIRETTIPAAADAFVVASYDDHDPVLIDADDLRALPPANAGPGRTHNAQTSIARALRTNGVADGRTMSFGWNAAGNVTASLSADARSLTTGVAPVTERNALAVADWAKSGNGDLIPAAKLPASAKRAEPMLGALGGLTEAQVDARVSAGVQDWAHDANNALVPDRKLPARLQDGALLTQAAIDARVTALKTYRGVYSLVTPYHPGDIVADAAPATEYFICKSAGTGTVLGERQHWLSLTAGGAGAEGLSQAAVDARVRALTADWAEAADNTPIPAGKLVNAPGGLNQAAVDARVAAGVADWAEQGNAAQIPANKLQNAPSGGGGGLDEAAVDARVTRQTQPLDARLDEVEEFESALRGSTLAADNQLVTVTADNEAYAVPGTTAVIPGSGDDREVEVVVTATGVPDGTHRFDVSELRGKAVAAVGDALTSTNGVEFVNTPDNNRYRIGRTATNAWLFSSDTADTYRITIRISQINVTSHVDAERLIPAGGAANQVLKKSSATDYDVAWAADEQGSGGGGIDAATAATIAEGRINSLIPANRRVPAYAQGDAGEVLKVNSTGNGLEFSPGGLDQAAVDARVSALVENFAEDGNAALVPNAKLPTTATRSDSDIQGIARGIVADWAETGDTQLVPDSKLSGRALWLDAFAADPAPADYSVGDLVNVAGVIKELVADSEKPNFYHGILGAPATGFRGDATVQWSGTAINVRLNRTVIGNAPPITLYTVIQTPQGAYVELLLDLQRSSSTPQLWHYTLASGQPLPPTAGRTVPDGGTFEASFWTNVGRTEPLRIHAAGANRWVVDARNNLQLGPALAEQSIGALDDVDITTTTPTDGQVLAWNAADGEFRPAAPASGGGGTPLTQANVYGQARNIIVPGSGVRVENSDADSTITLTGRALAPPSAATLPTDAEIGEVARLTAREADHPADKAFRFIDGDLSGSIELRLGVSTWEIIAFESGYTGAAQSALRGNVALRVPAGQLTNIPTHVVLYREGQSRERHPVVSTPVTGANEFHIITGLAYDDVDKTSIWRANVEGGNSPTFTPSFDPGLYRRGGVGQDAWALTSLGRFMPFITRTAPAAVVNLTSAVQDAWTDYMTLCTSPALTAEQVVNEFVAIKCHAHGVASPNSQGGGERLQAEARLLRIRSGQADLELQVEHPYGPRHLNVGTTYAAVTNDWTASFEFEETDLQVGDQYRLRVRMILQDDVRAMTMSFAAALADNRIVVHR